MRGVLLLPEELTVEILAGWYPMLSRRECEVLLWVLRGKRDGEIAQILQLSPATVPTHVRNLLGKLGAESRTTVIVETFSQMIATARTWLDAQVESQAPLEIPGRSCRSPSGSSRV